LGDKFWDFPQLLIYEFTPGNFGHFSILLLIAVRSQPVKRTPTDSPTRNPGFVAECLKTLGFVEIQSWS
jgi:hypothetical protein